VRAARVRGVADDGSDLVISRDYISYGLRSRATDLVSAELGPRCEHEIRSALAREVEAERWTRLDAALRMAADDIGFIDLRSDNPGEGDPQVRRLAVGPTAEAAAHGSRHDCRATPMDDRS
jgi:type IV secretory pathway VirD2 relaxase